MNSSGPMMKTIGRAAVAAATAAVLAAPAAAEEPPEVMWGKLIGTAGDDWGRSIALDAEGNVIIGGVMEQETPYGPSILNTLLAKYTPTGTLLWWRQDGSTADDAVYDVATDSAGNIYVVGQTWGSLFGPSAGSMDGFLGKYDSQGALLWGRQFGTSGSERATTVVVDSHDDVYIGANLVVVKYDPEGSPIWERELEFLPLDLAVDASGDVLVGGDLWLAKYTPAGDRVSVCRFESPVTNPVWMYSVAVDAAGNVHFAGEIYFSSADHAAALLLKFDAEGALLWSQQYDLGSDRDELWHGMALDAVGNIYVAGTSGPSWAFEGWPDMQLAKYGPAGDLVWAGYPLIGAGESGASDIVLDNSGNLFTVGFADRFFGIPGAGASDVFVARFRPACYADCDGSGATDFFDFLCFQSLFAMGDARADCDGSEVLDFLDFLCFQDAFAAGCPE